MTFPLILDLHVSLTVTGTSWRSYTI